MTLSHEVGHLFGAYHDEDTECQDLGKQSIMSASGTLDDHLQFSQCSLQEMESKMQELSTFYPDCFTTRSQVNQC